MGWWIVGSMFTVVLLGYVAHKFPTWFGAAVDAGAAVVNKIDNTVKADFAAANTVTVVVANTVSSNTATK